MANVTLAQAQEYMSVVGAVMPPNCDDDVWLTVLANAYRNGLITGFDWDSQMGAVALSLIEKSWPGYEKWKQDEGIDPDDFMNP